MPSLEERREVAARLRDMANRRGLYGRDVFFANLIDALSMERRTSVGEILERLADLIEPDERTCRVVREFVDIGGERMTDFTCCFNQNGWGHSYCPSCGARVIGGQPR